MPLSRFVRYGMTPAPDLISSDLLLYQDAPVLVLLVLFVFPIISFAFLWMRGCLLSMRSVGFSFFSWRGVCSLQAVWSLARRVIFPFYRESSHFRYGLTLRWGSMMLTIEHLCPSFFLLAMSAERIMSLRRSKSLDVRTFDSVLPCIFRWISSCLRFNFEWSSKALNADNWSLRGILPAIWRVVSATSSFATSPHLFLLYVCKSAVLRHAY